MSFSNTTDSTFSPASFASNYLQSTYFWVIAAFLSLYLYSPFTANRGRKLPGLPVAGPRSIFEPEFVTRYRSVTQAWAVIDDGYRKVWGDFVSQYFPIQSAFLSRSRFLQLQKFKDSAFTVLRPDSTLTVLPNRYVDELRNVSDTKLDGIAAIVEDLMGPYTGIDILLDSHLSFHAIRNGLAPKLGSLIPIIEEEMDFALGREIPSSKDWRVLDLNRAVLGIVSAITTRIFIGPTLCRDEDWLRINTKFVKQMFTTVLLMRSFPQSMRPVLGFCLPSRRLMRQRMAQMHAYLVVLIQERQKMASSADNRPLDVLQYMMDHAEGDDGRPEKIVLRYTYTILGALHTVVSAIVDMLYETCAHPEYVGPLRAEMQQVLREEGEGAWQKNSFNKLQKLDSFMKEAQRLNNVGPIALRRIVKEPMTLSDGLHLPVGTIICFRTDGDDRETTVNPDTQKPFDGFRYYRMRHEASDPETIRFDYATTDRNHLSFSHGRYACPGRYIASAEIKMALTKILLKYDLKFVEGQGRPKSLTAHDLRFNDPDGRIMVRERTTET